MIELEAIDGTNWQEFVGSPAAVLMLGKSDCQHCAEWTEELETYLGEESARRDVRFGKMLLDTPGLIGFKRANDWLAEVDHLPFNVVYQAGERVKSFPGGGIERLTRRIERVFGARPSP